MASVNALMTGLSGLLSNTRRLDVIGNNIANVNTTAFKANRVHFTPLYGVSGSIGGMMSGGGGGPLPASVGMGSISSGLSRSWIQGPIAATGIATDMAIDGAGFFMVQNGPVMRFTRDGTFLLDAAGNLVTRNGLFLQGFPVDANGSIVQTATQPINIPLGTLTIAAATSTVAIGGTLNASGIVASQGSRHLSQVFYLDPEMTQLAVGDEDLTETTLYIDDGTGTGTSIVAFDPADDPRTITLTGILKGGKPIPSQTFAISADPVPGAIAHGVTLADFAAFMAASLGLDSTTVNGQSLGGGVAIVDGQLVITGNEGTVQSLTITNANIVVNGGSVGQTNPFLLAQVQEANGESVRTTIAVYDSLGNPALVDVTFVLQARQPDGSTTWQMLVESNNPTVLPRVIQVGSVSFNGNGQLTSVQNMQLIVPQGTPPNNGPGQPLSINLTSALGPLRALADSNGAIATVSNDGAPPGTLSQFAVSADGLVVGGFTNGLTQVLAQLAIARFANADGLMDFGDNQFGATSLSGDAIVGGAGTFGMGRVLSGALEQANVDLSQEFVDMVQATTGFSAASRVITTADELLRGLLTLGR
ncbi:MAG: flagellar hook-basal body complex protein [Phycisphaeraceae bacterium]|nr:flagellar hook-basal body complex protein [Phycisphaeraceae bacterium]